MAEDSDGQLVRFTWRSVPGGVITEHVHPGQEERFIILAGEAHFTLNGAELVAGAGETVVVPAGVPHSEGNPGPAEIDGGRRTAPGAAHQGVARGRRRPGRRWQDHATRRAAQPAPARRHLLALPPRKPGHLTAYRVQNLMLPPLWALAKAFGVRPYYDHWDSRIRAADSGHPESTPGGTLR